MPAAAAAAIRAALAAGRRVVAVGTTTVRVLETVFGDAARRSRAAPASSSRPATGSGRWARMVTNFHLPRSTLLALVMAFAGIERTRELYRHGDRRALPLLLASATHACSR